MNRQRIAIPVVVLLLLAALVLPLAEMGKSGSTPSLEKSLFFPVKYPAGNWAPSELRFRDVYFASADGTRLHGWFCPVENSSGSVLIAHGNAGNVATRVPLLRHLQSRTKISTLIFDYRGYGRSQGSPSVAGALEDTKAALRELRRLTPDDSKTIYMGESLGGAFVIELAVDSPPSALILQSTFSSLHGLAGVHYAQFASLVPTTTLNSTSNIRKFRGELFQSHGESDKLVPIALARELFSAANEPKQFLLIEDSGHNDWQTAEYFTALDSFIATQLSKEI